jgi:CheY-like chemotaxis protein
MLEIADMFSATIRSKTLALIIAVDPDIPTTLESDQQKLKQIFVNIIGNAIKFTNSRHGVTGEIEVIVNWQDSQLSIEIKDNGTGIEKNKVDYLFKPFTQGDVSTNREYGGTGLGLPIVKGIVDLLEGTLICKSERFVGTSFNITIPIQSTSSTDKENSLANRFLALIGFTHLRSEALNQALHFYGATVLNFNNLDQYFTAEPQQNFDFVLASSEAQSPFSFINRTPLMWLNVSGKRDTIASEVCFYGIEANPFIASSVLQQLHSVLDGKTENVTEEHCTGESFTDEKNPTEKSLCEPPIINKQEEETDNAEKTRILVVEDNPHNREVIQYQLTMLGYHCKIVSDGQMAIECLKNESFNLVITDCHMPNVDGYQLTKMIRSGKLGINKDTIVIGLSGDFSDDGIAKCKESGMNDIIAKPAVMADINSRLTKLLSSPANHSAEIMSSADEKVEPYLLRLRIDQQTATEFLGNDVRIIERFRQFYIEKNQQLIEELTLNLQEQQIAKIEQITHKLKSSSKFIGAMRMNYLCEEVEQLCRQETGTLSDKCGNLVNKIIIEFEELSFEIK